MNNQAILQPKEEDRYLAVVVSKDDSNFYARGNKLWYKKKYSKHTSEFDDYTKMKVIGLLSNITEEQAKEMGYRPSFETNSSTSELKEAIKRSGLIYDPEQDVLLIKIN